MQQQAAAALEAAALGLEAEGLQRTVGHPSRQDQNECPICWDVINHRDETFTHARCSYSYHRKCFDAGANAQNLVVVPWITPELLCLGSYNWRNCLQA